MERRQNDLQPLLQINFELGKVCCHHEKSAGEAVEVDFESAEAVRRNLVNSPASAILTGIDAGAAVSGSRITRDRMPKLLRQVIVAAAEQRKQH